MVLGSFGIALNTQALEELEDRETARIAKLNRALRFPAKQFLGPGDRTIELRSTIYKEVLSPNGPTQVEMMRLWMRTGRRLPLIARSGHFYGFYLIEELTGKKTHVLPNGTFQKITLTRAPANHTIMGIPIF